ncbi:MAG: hypothetical protein KBS98_03105 [Flavobacterium sp.]|nr:hypothetical protein [Candidatus Neoflavobacterium equi]
MNKQNKDIHHLPTNPWDTETPMDGHELRFLAKLEHQHSNTASKPNLDLAASSKIDFDLDADLKSNPASNPASNPGFNTESNPESNPKSNPGLHQKTKQKTKQKTNSKSLHKIKPWAAIANKWMAAACLCILGSLLYYQMSKPAIPQPMQQTKQYFEQQIAQELAELKQNSSPESQFILNDALNQLHKLNADYDKLEKQLEHNGQNKQLINAMILNMQTRIDFLQFMMEQTERLNNLKNTTDEKNT